MGIKAYFKNASFSGQLAISFFVFLFTNILVAPAMLLGSQDASSLRLMMFISQLGTFVFSAFFLAYLFSDNALTYLKIKSEISWKVAIWIVLSMIVVLPFLNFTVWINEAMKLPEWMKPLEEWMKTAEEAARKITESILIYNNWFDLVQNLIIIALMAALGEELLFRGVLQNVFGKKIRNQHITIWIVAILFSAIHLQFYGFIPRMLMGAYFGYLIYYTRSMWAPILAHFTNNAFVILVTYKYQETSGQTDFDTIGVGQYWWVALISLIFWAFFMLKIVKFRRVYVNT